jgi:hypothetical protein
MAGKGEFMRTRSKVAVAGATVGVGRDVVELLTGALLPGPNPTLDGPLFEEWPDAASCRACV